MRQFEFSTSTNLDSWLCKPCDSEFAILTVLHCEDEDSGQPYDQVFNWGNPDSPPFCPRCGSKDGVRRDDIHGSGPDA